ncbi:type VI secretion system baseplate subunit TssE [Paraburkholderia unamae]|uniref:Type VI secretion system protein ImpF n=1 Tax=Paraburkholderia unamae TaxID=219649 RepID=A0ABX5KJC4_9BURK|nr:type VI secretion system baseplate subunit TssE [Paraburkholderia unamae]PVX75220.1 type VI secretion system protein ImpF [Paraburkholderia unamae]RAR57597.1 type VI secretion system protein ImpF [Paraburkholderia unamae]
MAELTGRDRLQPALLDRLTDLEREAKQETRERRVLSMRALRQGVQRDLAWLLNASGLGTVQDLSAYPAVAASVVNFGLPDIAGKTASGMDIALLERMIRDVIITFEPRIRRDTVRVSAILEEETTGRHNTVAFVIEGDLWAQPYPERLYFRTELDLEAGEVRVIDESAPRQKP